MPRKSAGLLPFRMTATGLEVLLVHPGGPFWASKDNGVWSIPKGELVKDEDPLAAARREFREEVGAEPVGETIPLEPVKQPGGKVVLAWALQLDFDPSQLRSNTFSMEWPPRSGKQRNFPEIDKAAWFDLSAARQKILKGQEPLLDQLLAKLSSEPL
jgi:predicted NUDIX family NTP pyrophosphohydrolase